MVIDKEGENIKLEKGKLSEYWLNWIELNWIELNWIELNSYSENEKLQATINNSLLAKKIFLNFIPFSNSLFEWYTFFMSIFSFLLLSDGCTYPLTWSLFLWIFRAADPSDVPFVSGTPCPFVSCSLPLLVQYICKMRWDEMRWDDDIS